MQYSLDLLGQNGIARTDFDRLMVSLIKSYFNCDSFFLLVMSIGDFIFIFI